MLELREYRGHIRNWEALATELGLTVDGTAAGRKAREEAIIKASYERWGYDCGNHFHGMFAFALYDPEQEELFCLRDQFGCKPFYYYLTADGNLLYGNDIRTIMAQEGFVKELNPAALQLYLTFSYVAGEETFFKGIKKLMPGRYLVFKRKEVRITRYWKPEFHPDGTKELEDWAEEIHSTMLQMMDEVKTADESADSFLSGGVDSSYVFALSDAEYADSIGYEEERFDESRTAEITAELLGRKFNRTMITPEMYFAEVPYVMENMEQPLGDASAIVFSLGCKAAAKRTKLCYSGEGSDELFGGYNIYQKAEQYGKELPNFYIGNTNLLKEDEKKRILKYYDPDVLPIDLTHEIYAENEGLDPLSKMSDVDIQLWLEGDIYLNVDKMSTACGLEIRMPITDTRIFDIASRMPSRFKVGMTTDEQPNKLAFRTAASRVLPDEVAFRKKLGFIVPIRVWMADQRYNSDITERLKSRKAERFFKLNELGAIWEEYLNGNSDLWRKIWVIYTFLVWYDIYFEN